jgi:hypothetical protein
VRSTGGTAWRVSLTSVDEGGGDEPPNDAVGDGVGQRHERDGHKGGHPLPPVRPVDVRDGGDHERARDEERGAGGPGGKVGDDGREEQGDAEAEARRHCRQTCRWRARGGNKREQHRLVSNVYNNNATHTTAIIVITATVVFTVNRESVLRGEHILVLEVCYSHDADALYVSSCVLHLALTQCSGHPRVRPQFFSST